MLKRALLALVPAAIVAIKRRSDKAAGQPVKPQVKRVSGADGTSLNVEIYGDSNPKTIVLVHGWTCNTTFWSNQIENLAGDYRVVVYDHRGHGKSDLAANDSYALEDFGADLDCVIDAITKPGDKPVLVGHSLGGMTIMTWSNWRGAKASEKISGVVICSSSSKFELGPTSSISDMIRLRVFTPLIQLTAPIPSFIAPLSPFFMKPLVLAKGASNEAVKQSFAMVAGCSGKVRGLTGSSIIKIDLQHKLGNIDVPTATLVGRDDLLTTVYFTEVINAGLPNLADTVIVDGIGHMSPLEAPSEVNDFIRKLAAAV